MLDFGRERAVAAEFVERLGIKTASIETPVGNLSGGNQQKVALARWLAAEPAVLILDEPTQGVDVGAKAEIHRLMGELAGRGLAIVMISSELPEILGMSDRIAVMHGGTDRRHARPRRGDPGDDHGAGAGARRAEAGGRVMIGDAIAASSRWRRLTACCCCSWRWSRPRFFRPESLRALRGEQRLGAGGGGRDDAGDPLPADRYLGRLAVRICGVVAGLLAKAGLPIPLVGLGTLLAGAGMGAVNGVLVAGLGLPSIVVTLATLVIRRESLRYVREGEFVRDLPPDFQWFGAGPGDGQWVVVGVALAVFVAFAWGLRNLAAGRAVYATGSDPEAARLAGIRPRRVVFARLRRRWGRWPGLAALLNAVRFADVDPNAGQRPGAAGHRRGRGRRHGDLGRARHAGSAP